MTSRDGCSKIESQAEIMQERDRLSPFAATAVGAISALWRFLRRACSWDQREAMIESMRPIGRRFIMVIFLLTGLVSTIENVGTVLLMLLVATLFKTVLSLTLPIFWLISVWRVHVLAANGISTLNELLTGTFGNEAAMLRRSSRRIRTAFGGLRGKQSQSDPASLPRPDGVYA